MYKELVETNTTLSNGSCTAAATAMAARLTAAGFAAEDVRLIVPPQFPRQGNLVALLRGRDSEVAPMLMIAHLDTVEAKASDWRRPPFTLLEDGGFFWGRGTSDGKAFASILVHTFIRYKREGYRPPRDLKLALTCGEETPDIFNGVQYLVSHHRTLIDAAFALTGGATGELDANGKPVLLGLQAGEKISVNFTMEATGSGGHSSRPTGTSAIAKLGHGLVRLGAHHFSFRVNEVTRAYFRRMASIAPQGLASDLAAVGQGSDDVRHLARIAAADPGWNAMMRTTCVATLLSGGEAINALPRRAAAKLNCRLVPGETVTEVSRALVSLLSGTGATIVPTLPPQASAEPAKAAGGLPLALMVRAAEAAARRIWPGTPVVPTLTTGATDGRFLNQAGIPSYGLSGIFREPDGNGAHATDERMRIRSFYQARDFLYDAIKRVAGLADAKEVSLTR